MEKEVEIKFGGNKDEMPQLAAFDFVEELFVFWTRIDDISEIEHLHNLKKLYLDNGVVFG